MEGVLVTAKKDGAPTTVVSDNKGHYAFPADRPTWPLQMSRSARRLHPAARIADVGAGDGECRLSSRRKHVAQLTSAEWLASMPHDERSFPQDCTTCRP
jgi:hypothetical protein